MLLLFPKLLIMTMERIERRRQMPYHIHISLELLGGPNVTGPEDDDGMSIICQPMSQALRPLLLIGYTGVADGRVIKYGGPSFGFTNFAYTTPTWSKAACDGKIDLNSTPTCGRALGLGLNYRTNQLYITDAYPGLLVVGYGGGFATPIATTAEGVPFGFPNSLDVEQMTGKVYFTVASSVYRIREIPVAVAVIRI